MLCRVSELHGGRQAKIICVPEFDVTVPNIARVYDYWLGGKDHYAADRELGDKLLAQYPPTAELVRENKQFMRLAVTWVAEQGVRQFIDLGAGLPTSPSTQETAQAIHPGAKVAYVDNDPVVNAHLRALLAHNKPGVTVVDHDIRDVDAVVAEISAGMDLREPACLMLGSLLHFFPVEEGREMLSRYVAALMPGSYVIVSVGRSSGEQSEKFLSTYRQGGVPLYYYSADDVETLFADLEVVPPGISEPRAWGIDPGTLAPIPERMGDMAAAVARVPA
jgi:O-methyltransferase involved in polyketide biosynthesis